MHLEPGAALLLRADPVSSRSDAKIGATRCGYSRHVLLLFSVLLLCGHTTAHTGSQLLPHWLTWNRSLRTVRVAQGVLRGRILSVRSSTLNARPREVEVFLGVPYAAPPVGRLRFQAPQAATTWEGERELVKMPPSCVQAFPNISGGEEQLSARMSTARLNYLRKLHSIIGDTNQSEDCLYLNIFVPASKY